ncbi:MAG: lysophospholipid acyltransferase family protein [Alistipes sp.]|jgi:KDO2-lipid IV(A) lauroyltransferase|nr:lysophospholipid acyltransferase family protein [Alistipes sp.]
MSNKTDSLGVRLGYRAVYGACWLFGLLPHWVLYHPVADVVYFLLYRVVRYRVKVVRENLAASFPERSEAELRGIERRFFRNLAEYFIDAIDIASITPRGRIRRCPWPDANRAELVSQTAGRNWVALLSHYGSWEMLSAFGLYRDASAMVSAYRPLKNRVFDLYYIKVRNVPPRVNSVPSSETLRFLSAHRDGIDGSSLSVALIADQIPPIDAQSRWVKFLNHPTVFFHGGEKIARKFAMPVYYMRVRKVGRGMWEQTFDLIWDGVSPTSDYDITGAYARLLEEDIRRTPELWLWSHRRWKWGPQGDDARAYEEKYGSL